MTMPFGEKAYDDILKRIPEPDIYENPDPSGDLWMRLLWHKVMLRDRCTWVAKQNVLIYRWAKAVKPFYQGKNCDQPLLLLSDMLRPGKNRASCSMIALADTLGKYRPGTVPVDETRDFVNSTHVLFETLKSFNRSPSLEKAENAFDEFVAIWCYTGRARTTQNKYRENLLTHAQCFIDSLGDVWMSFLDMEHRLAGDIRGVQLELSDITELASTFELNIKEVNEHILAAQEKTRQQTSYATRKILEHLPEPDTTPDAIRKAMLDRARFLIANSPTQSTRGICQKVVDDYEGIAGAYTSADTLRKQLNRKSSTI